MHVDDPDRNYLLKSQRFLVTSHSSTVCMYAYPYEMCSAVAALQNSFKKRCKIAVKWLAAAVANFSC